MLTNSRLGVWISCGAKRAMNPAMRALRYCVGRNIGQFCSSVTASAMSQCLCVACVLWLFPAAPPQSIRTSNHAMIHMLTVHSISYRPLEVVHISSQEVGQMTGEGAAPLSSFSHPRLPYA